MLSNAYFVAKFRFDTAENEPAKNLQNFRKMHFPDHPPAQDGRLGASAAMATREQIALNRELTQLPPRAAPAAILRARFANLPKFSKTNSRYN